MLFFVNITPVPRSNLGSRFGLHGRGSCNLHKFPKVECRQMRAYDVRVNLKLDVLRCLQGRRNDKHVTLDKGLNHNVVNLQHVVQRSIVSINQR